MATNFYFNNFEASAEQTLIEDLVIESIKMYGHDVVYLPRTIINRDYVFNEDSVSKFVDQYSIEMYIRDVDGFQGEGDFLSKFGVEVRDQITFTVANRRFEEDIASVEDITRPREGDIIYFPLTQSHYEIKFVEHEAVFYQLGELQMYDLRCELYEYSGEEFSTGSDLLDAIEDNTKINLLDYSLLTQDGLLLSNETGGPIIREVFDINTITQANNNIYQTESSSIIDFSELDPFSEGTY
jgi:hypothetical protein